jgi:hypothetical protein
MLKQLPILIFIIALPIANTTNAQSWVPNDSVPNTHANQPSTIPNPGNSNYSTVSISLGTSYGTSYSNDSFSDKQAAEQKAKKQEDAAKKKWCKENNYPTFVSFCSVYKIEEEVHRKFCQQQPTKIETAVQECQRDGLVYTNSFIASGCSGGAWSFGFSNKESGLNIGYNTDVSAKFCRDDSMRAYTVWTMDCSISGRKYHTALESQCSDL